MLALSQSGAAAILSIIAIVIGFIVCFALWWLMVFKPSREERARRERQDPPTG